MKKIAAITTTIILVVLVTTPLAAQGSRSRGGVIDIIVDNRKAPAVVSGDNIYIAW